MAHYDCGWTCGCSGKTVKSLENTRHTWALLRWWFTTKRRYIKCMHLYLLTALQQPQPTPWHVVSAETEHSTHPCNLSVRQQTQLSLTNPRDAFIGQSRSPNIVPFHMLDIVSDCAIVTFSLRHDIFTIFDFKNALTLKPGIGSVKVIGNVTMW